MILFFHLFIYFPDWAPQILELEGNLEWNLNSTPKIFCSATGNPLPSHNSIELRKLDSTVLKVENTDKIYRVYSPLTDKWTGKGDNHVGIML